MLKIKAKNAQLVLELLSSDYYMCDRHTETTTFAVNISASDSKQGS